MLEDLNLKTGQIVSTSEESAKIIDNFSCYIVCVLKHEKIEEKQIEVEDKITLKLSGSEELQAQIVYISKESENEDLVVFKTNKYVEQLINYRKISLDVIWWDISGLRVANNAIKQEKDDLYYVIRKRVGYIDKIYVKILKQGEKYSIIENYDDNKELINKGISEEDVKSRKRIALYDEIKL